MIGGGKYKVEAEVGRVDAASEGTGAGDAARNELVQADASDLDGATDWVAHLSVKVDQQRTERATLALSPARLRKTLAHIAELIDDFRSMAGVAPEYLARERDEAARAASTVETLRAAERPALNLP